MTDTRNRAVALFGDLADTARMTGDELTAARTRLGKLWGIHRPVSKAELGRALRVGGRDPGERIGDYEKGTPIPGPVSVAVEMMLNGALPPDGIPKRGG